MSEQKLNVGDVVHLKPGSPTRTPDQKQAQADHPTESSELKQEFLKLASAWRAGRGPFSSAQRLAQHPAYQKIVALGKPAIPLILAELERKPEHWFLALYEITGIDPVPEQSRGRLKQMAEAWIHWGREQGYQW